MDIRTPDIDGFVRSAFITPYDSASIHPTGSLLWAMDRSLAVRIVVALLLLATVLLTGLLFDHLSG